MTTKYPHFQLASNYNCPIVDTIRAAIVPVGNEKTKRRVPIRTVSRTRPLCEKNRLNFFIRQPSLWNCPSCMPSACVPLVPATSFSLPSSLVCGRYEPDIGGSLVRMGRCLIAMSVFQWSLWSQMLVRCSFLVSAFLP